MRTDDLIEELEKLSSITNEQWIGSLDDRKLKELEFHDLDRNEEFKESLDQDAFEKFYGNRKFYSTVARSVEYTQSWIQHNAKDKIFLDYACGNGSYALLAAEAGARLSIGIDISSVSVDNAREEATRRGLHNVFFLQADAENTMLPDCSIDTVICSGMLHHLDLSFALPELRRILGPGGKILAVEALDYNPLIKFYRWRTPSMRTEWEKAHILSLRDVGFAKRFFEIGEVKFWHVTSYAGAMVPKLLPVLNLIDRVLTRIPLIRRMAWIFTFELLSQSDLSEKHGAEKV